MRIEDKLFTARISRHLLFNSLNSAIVLCRRNPEEASELLSCLSQCLIYTSDQNTQLVPLEDEITFIKYYLHIQSVRFGQRLQVIYNIQETTGRVPPFTLQPIVDNIFSHVMLQTREGVTITIEVKKSDGGIIATVKDNRVGMDHKQLENFWERYQGRSLHRLNIALIESGMKELHIDSNKNKGTTVSVWGKT